MSATRERKATLLKNYWPCFEECGRGRPRSQHRAVRLFYAIIMGKSAIIPGCVRDERGFYHLPQHFFDNSRDVNFGRVEEGKSTLGAAQEQRQFGARQDYAIDAVARL